MSKGTLSNWLARVPYTPNEETVHAIGRARAASGAAKSALKEKSIQDAMNEARLEIGSLSERDRTMIGIGLYIGEGSKSHDQAVFVNANPKVVRFMVRWFCDSLGIPPSNLRVRLHLYPDSDAKLCKEIWAREIEVPEGQFVQASIDVRGDKKIRKAGKLPIGTAHVSVRGLGDKRFGVFLARKIMACSSIALSQDIAELV